MFVLVSLFASSKEIFHGFTCVCTHSHLWLQQLSCPFHFFTRLFFSFPFYCIRVCCGSYTILPSEAIAPAKTDFFPFFFSSYICFSSILCFLFRYAVEWNDCIEQVDVKFICWKNDLLVYIYLILMDENLPNCGV